MTTEILNQLVDYAKNHHDGHLTIMRSTTNWRVGFFTPDDRDDVDVLAVGMTFEEAAHNALTEPVKGYDKLNAMRGDDDIADFSSLLSTRFSRPFGAKR